MQVSICLEWRGKRMKRETGVNPVRARRCKNGVSVKYDIHWIFPGREAEMLMFEPEDLPAMNDK